MKLEITDVTLRDGIQMERSLPLEQKLELLQVLKGCGYERLEITSFVNPKWVPQFEDADRFCEKAFKITKVGDPETMAFVPNERGLERGLQFPFPWFSAFIATSETFNQKNVNATIDESLQILKNLVSKVRAEKRRIRVYVSTVFGCPYEKKIPDSHRDEVLARVANLDPDEIALSDTIGVALPDEVRRVVEKFSKVFPVERTALHLHNTYGLGLASAIAGKEAGIAKFDGSTAGIGGCPYAKGATGNLSADSLLYLFHRLGMRPHFPLAQLKVVFEKLSKLGLPLHSPLSEVLKKGGELYGVE